MSIEEILSAFSQMKVLVIGDVMLDRYLKGKVDRISPEAPVPVVALESEENRLGGAANVALNLAALGATPYLCSVIGEDENARIFRQLLPDQGLTAEGVCSSKERPTTVKTRVMANHQQLLRVDRETQYLLSPREESELLGNIQTLLNKYPIDAILFQDYNKGVLTPRLIQQCISWATERKIVTVVDPKKDHFFAYKGVTLFKPNLKEVRDSLPFRIDVEKEDLNKAADYLREQLNSQIHLITLSENGLFIENESGGEIFPTHSRNITDVCGAGDTVVSVACLATALRLPLDQIALLSNLSGGQVCEKVGVVPVNKDQLKREYQEKIAAWS